MSDEKPVVASLIMDRSYPVGNSKGDDNRGRLHVKVSNKTTEAIPVTFGDMGSPLYVSAQDVTSPGVDKPILSYTVLPNEKLQVQQFIVSCRTESVFTFTINSIIVGTIRTGAARPNDRFVFTPTYPVLQNEIVEVTVKARSNSPISDCEVYLQASVLPTI